MNLSLILNSILRLAFPALPRWVAPLVIAIVTEALALVREVEGANAHGSKKKLSGAEKFVLVADRLEVFLKRRTSAIPGWSKIDPARRRKMVGGIIELAVFIVDISDGKLDLSNTRPTAAQVAVLRARGYKRVGTLNLDELGKDDEESEE